MSESSSAQRITSQYPNSARRIRELRDSFKDPLFFVIIGICSLGAIPGALAALWGMFTLATDGRGLVLVVCGALLFVVTMALPVYVYGVNLRAARSLEWMLGPGASQIDWLYVRRANYKGQSVGHHVVAVHGNKRVFATAKTRAEAEWILRDVMTAAPNAQLDTDGTLIASGLGDRGFGFTERAG